MNELLDLEITFVNEDDSSNSSSFALTNTSGVQCISVSHCEPGRYTSYNGTCTRTPSPCPIAP